MPRASASHIGYAAMLERFPPREVVELATLAEPTSGDLRTGLTAPTFRSHPALTAQAS